MKRKQKYLLPFLLFSLLSCSTPNKESISSLTTEEKDSLLEREMIEVPLELSINDKKEHSINPNIYGTFIEHIETCIYNGICAEVIQDRKFYQPVNQDVSQWTIQEGDVKGEVEHPFEGTYSPILTTSSTIRQIGLSLSNKEYEGYLYAKGNGTLKLTYTINSQIEEILLSIHSTDYQKYNYSFTSNFETRRATLAITALDSSITIDSLSLMPKDNYYGMRKDTLDKLKELKSPFYRWPGGNFVSGYDFYDGIGDRDKRPARRNLNYIGQESDFDNDADRLANDLMKIGSLGYYGAFEPNDFGLDEFITMCRYLEAEPNIVINAGLGSVTMAKDEVEYCNGKEGRYASLRPQKEPYHVKYFSIGNEMNGDWQLGHTDINTYTKRHNDFAKVIKSVDPSIEIIAVGDNSSNWTKEMVSACSDYMDYTSEHFYAERKENDVKEHILSMKNQAATRINNHRNIPGISKIKIAIDEYAYMDAEVSSRLKDGMGIASGVNEMIKNSDVVSIACYSSTVNTTQGQIATDNFNAYLEGSGYALSLYRNNLKEYYLPARYKQNSVSDYYEVLFTINQDKTEIAVSIINTSDKILKFTHPLFQKGIKQDIFTGEFLESSNSSKNQELSRYQRELNANYAIAEPRSISVTTIKL